MSGSSGEKRTGPPQFVEDAQKEAIRRAMEASDLGYVPYQGPTVAALSPMQLAAMNAASSDARAFGYDAPMDARSGMPETMTMGGVTGYSPYPMYIEALERLKQTAPEQYNYIMSRRFDPNSVVREGEYDPNSVVRESEIKATGGGGGSVDLNLPTGKAPDLLAYLRSKNILPPKQDYYKGDLYLEPHLK